MGLSTRTRRLSPAARTASRPRVRHHVARPTRRPPGDLRIDTEPDPRSVAHALRPLAVAILGDPLPIRVVTWDGSAMGPVDGPGTIRVNATIALFEMEPHR